MCVLVPFYGYTQPSSRASLHVHPHSKQISMVVHIEEKEPRAPAEDPRSGGLGLLLHKKYSITAPSIPICSIHIHFNYGLNNTFFTLVIFATYWAIFHNYLQTGNVFNGIFFFLVHGC